MNHQTESDQPVYVKELFQKDNHSFAIEWSDACVGTYRLSDLQKNCPCANCVDEMTGKRRNEAKSLDENVSALRIISVGRYALRIEFTSGCSSGIFSFDQLRELSNHSLL